MIVGCACTYVDPNGHTKDALIAKISDDGLTANLVVVNALGADDYFGKSRAELTGVQIGTGPGRCCTLDTDLAEEEEEAEEKEPKTKPKTKKKS